jgi:hypothetical protein
MESTVILEVGVSNTGTRYVCINTKLRSQFSGREWFVVEEGGGSGLKSLLYKKIYDYVM